MTTSTKCVVPVEFKEKLNKRKSVISRYYHYYCYEIRVHSILPVTDAGPPRRMPLLTTLIITGHAAGARGCHLGINDGSDSEQFNFEIGNDTQHNLAYNVRQFIYLDQNSFI